MENRKRELEKLETKEFVERIMKWYKANQKKIERQQRKIYGNKPGHGSLQFNQNKEERA